MLSFSCMDCIDRTERCHATCERYAKYKKEIEIIKQAKEWESLANSRPTLSKWMRHRAEDRFYAKRNTEKRTEHRAK